MSIETPVGRDLVADDDLAILTAAEMRRAERLAMDAPSGAVSGMQLMEAAGEAVARAIGDRLLPQETLVLCGPGNNGGDGFVVARHLEAAGWPVTVATLGDPTGLTGDAAEAADLWDGAILQASTDLLGGRPLIVDALFGTGLSRPLTGIAAELVEEINRLDLFCVAVDLPSGLDADGAGILGVAPRCALTVTFFRPRPAHVSLPGRDLCGEVVVGDIGLPRGTIGEVGPRTWRNGPGLWAAASRRSAATDHKYSRGHLTVLGGALMTGAARLVALAARRTGAGLVTIAAIPAAVPIYQLADPGNLVFALTDERAWDRLAADPRRNVFVVGPGAGDGDDTRDRVLRVLRLGRGAVVDADGISAFAGDPARLFGAIAGPTVLTPHEGEFARLFPDLALEPAKLVRAREAARRSGAVVVLKGADTTIAAPDGRVVINDNAPPTLATAGTGDVLAGMIGGLLAQGMSPLAAAACGVWLHGAAAASFGPGLIAEDVVERIPVALASLVDGARPDVAPEWSTGPSNQA